MSGYHKLTESEIQNLRNQLQKPKENYPHYLPISIDEDKEIFKAHCPLKPLPEEKHRDTRFNNIAGAIDYGWNSCLAALEGKDMVDKLIEYANRILEKKHQENKK